MELAGSDMASRTTRLTQVPARERFTTTIFVVLFWLPLILTGTYRVQGEKQLFSSDMIILEKLPLDWTQVLGVWAAVAVSLLGLTLAFKFLPSFLSRVSSHRYLSFLHVPNIRVF